MTARGSGLADEHGELRHAGGPEDWAVYCWCGTRDDDGQRMLECSCCGNWVHARCEGLDDSCDAPPNFRCRYCKKKGKRKW